MELKFRYDRLFVAYSPKHEGEGIELDLTASLEMASVQGAFDRYLLLTLLVMVIAGALGGLVNHYLEERQSGEEAPSRDEGRSLRRHLLFGVVTVLTAPLLLAILSSTLLESIRVRPSDLYVFAAFCLAYGVAVQRIFGNSAHRRKLEQVQREVRQLKHAQEAWRQYLEPLLESVQAQQELKNDPREVLTYNDVELLRALVDESYVYGNLAALTEKTGLERELISQRLIVLKNVGLIETRINDKNILHWVISSRGRQALTDVLTGQDGEKASAQNGQEGGRNIA
jgi:DNA-binding transcriptional ArsR family regulator